MVQRPGHGSDPVQASRATRPHYSDDLVLSDEKIAQPSQTRDFLLCKTTTIPTTSSAAKISAPIIQPMKGFGAAVDVNGVEAVAVASAAVVTLSDS